MSRRKLTEDEYNDIKRMHGQTSAIARIAHRSDETIRFIWQSKDYEEFMKMRRECSDKIKQSKGKKAECHYGIGDKFVATTVNGTLLSLLDENKEDMVKLFTKPIPKSKAEAIQKALQEAGIGLFEDYFYVA